MDQLDALEAAKLAALVGGQLQDIDRNYIGSVNNPANKININAFKVQAQNPNLKQKPASYLMNYPAGFVPPPDEQVIRAQVPDVIPPVVEPQVNPNTFPSSQQPEVVNLPNKVFPTFDKKQNFEFYEPKPMITRSDIDSVRNSLKNIDKTLVGMLTLLKNSNLVDNNE